MAHEARMPPGAQERIALVTAPDEAVAERLARGLVGAGLAACVNRLPGVRSTYVWKGEVEEEGEVLLVIKTAEGALEALAAFLDEHHPYETPECVTLAPAEVERGYLAWWRGALGAP